MELLNLVRSSWVGMFEIFLMGLCGFILVRKKILPQDVSKILSKLVMDLALPLLIFSKMIVHFRFDEFKFWWLLPLVSIIMIFIGLFLGRVLSFGVNRDFKRDFISLCGYQNSGYLVLALITSMFAKEMADTLFIYVFLFLAGFNFIIWSLGVFYLRHESSEDFNWKNFLTLPFIAVSFSLIIIAFGLSKYIPNVLLTPCAKIGATTVPLGMIAIGAILGEVNFRFSIDIKNSNVIRIALIKLILLPFIVLLILSFINLPSKIKFFIFLESLMPSATSLAIIARRYRQEYLYIVNAVFMTHVLSLVTIPLFIALYYKFFI